jgi:replicative DNA helicase
VNDDSPNWQNAKRRKAARPDVATDELPPHAAESEQAVIGCLLYDAPQVRARLDGVRQAGLTGEWFYDLRHQEIFHALERCAATLPEATQIDIIVLQQRLKDVGLLEQIGGIPYLNALQDGVPSAANISYHLDIVREKWIARKSQAVLTEAALRIKEHSGAVEEALDELQRDVEHLADQSVPRSSHLAKAFMPAVIDGIEDYHRGHAQMRGIPTGLDYVDKMLCGLGGLNSKIIIIAARPSTGKTALALDIAQHVACDASWFKPLYNPDFTRQKGADGIAKSIHMQKTPVGIFSFEMTGLALTDRLVFQRARADKQRWRNGFATDQDLVPLVQASTKISAAPIHIDDVPCTAEQLCAKARQMHRQHGIELFIVDYLQLIYSQKDFRGDRVQELGHISRMFALTAKALNVPFIIIAQMNRDAEKEPNREPRLSDLKDSGAIEQDADVVAFLYQPKLKDDAEERWDLLREKEWPGANGGTDWSKAPKRINLLIAKYRNGPTGPCELLFHKSCMHFEDYNLWQKRKGYKAAAAGESQRGLIDDEDIPA